MDILFVYNPEGENGLAGTLVRILEANVEVRDDKWFIVQEVRNTGLRIQAYPNELIPVVASFVP